MAPADVPTKPNRPAAFSLGSCRTVASLGCTVYHTVQDGVTATAWQTMLDTYPSPGRVFPC